MGQVGLEPTNSEEGRFTVSSNCHYATDPNLQHVNELIRRSPNRFRTDEPPHYQWGALPPELSGNNVFIPFGARCRARTDQLLITSEAPLPSRRTVHLNWELWIEHFVLSSVSTNFTISQYLIIWAGKERFELPHHKDTGFLYEVTLFLTTVLEVLIGFEPMYEGLQPTALPLDHSTIF